MYWTWFGSGLLDAYVTGGPAAYTSLVRSVESAVLTDLANWEEVNGGAITFSDVAATSSYLTSLYSKVQSEATYLYGTEAGAVMAGEDFTTDGCLFTSCTNQYYSESSSFYSTTNNE